MGNRKEIAKFLMRTFTCRSTFLYAIDVPLILIMQEVIFYVGETHKRRFRGVFRGFQDLFVPKLSWALWIPGINDHKSSNIMYRTQATITDYILYKTTRLGLWRIKNPNKQSKTRTRRPSYFLKDNIIFRVTENNGSSWGRLWKKRNPTRDGHVSI